MPIKKIKPEGTSFHYNPGSRLFTLFTEIQFIYSFTRKQFEIDQNPVGEPMPVPFTHLKIADDLSLVTCSADYRKKPTDFEIHLSFAGDKVLYSLFRDIQEQGLALSEEDKEDLQIDLEDGVLTAIRSFKDDLHDSLHLFREEGKYYLVKQRPWRRFEVLEISIKDDTIYMKTAEETFTYHLDLQPVIARAATALIEAGLVKN